MNDILFSKQQERLDALYTDFVSLKVGTNEYYQCLESIRLEERKGVSCKKVTRGDEFGGVVKSPLCEFSVLERRERR